MNFYKMFVRLQAGRINFCLETVTTKIFSIILNKLAKKNFICLCLMFLVEEIFPAKKRLFIFHKFEEF